MKRKLHDLVLLALLALPCPRMLPAATASLTVQTGQPGVRINPAMWGIFFEDIKLDADGGLYAELVKNRSFEFPDPMMGWFKLQRPQTSASTSPVRRGSSC